MSKIIKQFLNDDNLSPSIRDIFTQKLIPFTVKNMEKGEILWYENENHNYSYYVESGIIKLHATTQEGREKALFFYTTGSLLGFQNFAKDKKTITVATAVLPTKLYAVQFDLFYKFIAENSQYLSALIEYIFHHMNIETQEIVNISFYNTTERLAALLVFLSDDYSKKEGIGKTFIPLNNDELGNMVGACRNSISRALSVFQNQNMIHKKRGGLIITDLNSLKEFAKR